MKKLLFLLALVIGSFTANAQNPWDYLHASTIKNYTECEITVTAYCYDVNPCNGTGSSITYYGPITYTIAGRPGGTGSFTPQGVGCNCPIYPPPGPNPWCAMAVDIQYTACFDPSLIDMNNLIHLVYNPVATGGDYSPCNAPPSSATPYAGYINNPGQCCGSFMYSTHVDYVNGSTFPATGTPEIHVYK